MILRENGEWLRYVLWAGAVGLCFVTAAALGAPERDLGKVIGGVLGVLLFAFSGWVYQTHIVEVDTLRREVRRTRKGFRKSRDETIPFAAVQRIALVETVDYDGELMPANRWQRRWCIALVCDSGPVVVTNNPYVNRQSAMRDAIRLQQAIGVGLTDSVEESIAILARTGRTTEARALGARTPGPAGDRGKDLAEK
jgi:hypothetical protein